VDQSSEARRVGASGDSSARRAAGRHHQGGPPDHAAAAEERRCLRDLLRSNDETEHICCTQYCDRSNSIAVRIIYYLLYIKLEATMRQLLSSRGQGDPPQRITYLRACHVTVDTSVVGCRGSVGAAI